MNQHQIELAPLDATPAPTSSLDGHDRARVEKRLAGTVRWFALLLAGVALSGAAGCAHDYTAWTRQPLPPASYSAEASVGSGYDGDEAQLRIPANTTIYLVPLPREDARAEGVPWPTAPVTSRATTRPPGS